MNAHLRASLWLLGLTVVLCCLLYPLALWAVGRTVFTSRAAGSLIDRDGNPTRNETEAVGSRLIAQPFNGPEYFHPRPSAPSYDASASGGSNYGANNPKLRARIAQALGPIVQYRSGPKQGELVGKDIEEWFARDRFQNKPHVLAQWARRYPFLAKDWIKADRGNADYVGDWQTTHSKEVAEWMRENPDTKEPKPEDLAVPFFVSFSAAHPGRWPGAVKHTIGDTTETRIEPVSEGEEIQRNFFDLWLQDHSDVDLVEVPADMVMASGSGLDPHITLKNARYQLDRVADAWAKKTGADALEVHRAIETMLTQQAKAPFGGLAGIPLVNVVEANLALPGAVRRIGQ